MIVATELQDSTCNWQLNALQGHGITNGTGIPHWSRIFERRPNKAYEQALDDGCGSRTSSKALQAEELEGKFLLRLDFGKVGRPRQPICQRYTKMTSLMIPGNFWTAEDKRRFVRVACLTLSSTDFEALKLELQLSAQACSFTRSSWSRQQEPEVVCLEQESKMRVSSANIAQEDDITLGKSR